MLLGIVLHGLLSFMPFPFWPGQDRHQYPETCGVIVNLIHGFRMPLFFLMSGFFTMLLIERRGLSGLVKNRILRILVPLIAGTIVVAPMIWGVAVWGGAKKAKIAASRTITPPDADKSIWMAAKNGEIDRLKAYLADGGNANARDDVGISLLSWAGMAGRDAAVDLLIENGVNLNAKDQNNRTALHGAAFMGRVAIVQRLLNAGAKINVTGTSRDTPLDSASSNVKALNWLGTILKLDFDPDAVMNNREEIKTILREAGGKYGAELPLNLVTIYKAAAFAPVFQHLWFLHYLIWFSAALALLNALGKALKIPTLPASLLRAPLCLVWLVPLTTIAQSMMTNPFGPDTAGGIFLWPPIFLYYGIFVLYGALSFGRDVFSPAKSKLWILYLLLASGVGTVAMLDIKWATAREIIQPLIGAVYVWLMCFGLIGAFRFFFVGENKKIRWLSDSAYWLYLAHLPLIMALQVWVSDWDLPGIVKFLFIVIFTTALLLITYQLFIRYSFIGTILNGKKTRPHRRQSPS